jgi:hypothetical protein
MIIKSKRAWIAYARGLPKVSDVWIKIKCQIQIYTIVSHHNSNKPITITYIAKYEKCLYNNFDIYFPFTLFKKKIPSSM